MNWFTEVYQHWILSSDPTLVPPDFSGVSLLLAMTLLLLRFRRITWRLGLAAIALFVLIDMSEFDLKGVTHGMDFLPNSLRNLTYEGLLVVGLWLAAMALTGLSLFRARRTVDRLIVGVSGLVVACLLYGYHVLIVNGDLLTTLKTEEQFLSEAAQWGEQSRQSLCNTTGYDCLEGAQGSPFVYPESSEITHQVNDYLRFYRARSPEGFRFTLSRGLSVANQPFAAVVTEGSSGYQVIVSRQRPLYWMNSAKTVFGILAWAAQAFWIFFAVGTMAGHHWMFWRRKRRRRATEEMRQDEARLA